MSNGTKRRIEIMSKVGNADWDIMSNGKKCRMEILPKVRNAEWDIMLNIEYASLSILFIFLFLKTIRFYNKSANI